MARSCVFSPVDPHFRGTTGRQQNSLTLKAYMEGIHVGFGRRICTDASSKPLPITTVLSAVFSSPWHKSDGQNCVAPAMERFSSEFWCGGRRNTRVFQGRQAGNHRKSLMSGGTDPFHVCPCFLPVNLVFIVAALLSRCRCGGACPPSRREFLF